MSSYGYAHPELIVETNWLAAHAQDPHVRIIDAEPSAAYQRAHIPGAVNVPWESTKDPGNPWHVATPKQFAEMMARAGVGKDTLVILYDGEGLMRHGVRVWWTLTYYGHTRAKVLNGGWQKWMAEGRPISLDTPQVTRATFTPRRDASIFADARAVADAIDKQGSLIWDVRSDGEWDGSTVRALHGGRIPSATHLEWLTTLRDTRVPTMKPAAEIRRMLQEHGVTPDKKIVTY